MPNRTVADTQFVAPSLSQLSGQPRGKVLSHCTLYDVPSSHSAQTPLHFALVRLQDGRQILAQLTDLVETPQISIGDEVEMVTRILTTEGSQGVIVYGYKFRPILRDENLKA